MQNKEEQMDHNGLNGLNQTPTAVEWLIEKMLSQDWYTYKSLEYIEQAKEMERQQIIDAITQYEIKYNNVFSEQGILNVVNKAEEYYNETFN